MGKLAFQSDYYFNNEKKIEDMFGDMACPVDMNAGYVSSKTDKWGMDEECGKEIQANIQERFALVSPNGSEDY